MRLKAVKINGFKSFDNVAEITFPSAITAVVGPNGSGKSNITESFRFVLGEQSMKSLRGRRGEDLIWNGGGGGSSQSRASVQLTFNNEDNFFDGLPNELVIKRIVHKEGTNEYFINNSPARLKDIIELLAKASMGSTGHHIISQGEADRILNANHQERKEMIEDGLGLKLLQYRKQEAEKKLDKTIINIKEIESVRRELAPHTKYLKKQVERVERAEELKKDLEKVYCEYLKVEQIKINSLTKKIKQRKQELETQSQEIEKGIVGREDGKLSKEEIEIKNILKQSESKLNEITEQKQQNQIELGRKEGEFSAKTLESNDEYEEFIPVSHIKQFQTEALSLIKGAEGVEEASKLQSILLKVKSLFGELLTNKATDKRQDFSRLKSEISALKKEIEKLAQSETELKDKINTLRQREDKIITESRMAERELYKLNLKRSELNRMRDSLKKDGEILADRNAEFERELSEAKVLTHFDASQILQYEVYDPSGVLVPDKEIEGEASGLQDRRRKSLERLKIRLEEIGTGSGEDVLKEYKEINDREEFLQRELDDLHKSLNTLRDMIKKLNKEIEKQFKNGINEINAHFDKYFKTLFRGGKASIKVVKIPPRRTAESEENQEEEKKEGIVIVATPPSKKACELEQLSGGERSLISIALLFAISQVTPPPFLILDETDAALDEANSKRYGDMIEMLAKQSQLILVTHNRETMSRAGNLYGVTMDRNGASQLLSVNLEKAVEVAK